MHREGYAEYYIKKELWGYPDLLKRFFNKVRPALADARDTEKAQEEKEEQEGQELGHINIDPPHPTSDGGDQDMCPTLSDPPNTLDPPGAKPDTPHATEIEVLQDSEAEPDVHLSRPAMAVVGNLEEPDPTTPDASQQLEAPSDEEERQQSHSNTSEALSASENQNEGSQSNKESGE